MKLTFTNLKKLCLVFFTSTLFAFNASAQIDQQQTQNDATSTINQAESFGQSFTCETTGTLTQIDVAFSFMNANQMPGAFTIAIYSGSGLDGAVLLPEQIVSFPASASGTLNISSLAVPVTAGQVYTFALVLQSPEPISLYTSNMNPYIFGTSYYNGISTGTNDLTFTTYVTPSGGGVPTTKLTNAYCNMPIPTLSNSTQIRCDAVAGAWDYQYEFTNMTTGQKHYKRRGAKYTNFFLKAVFWEIQLNTTYQVRVRATVGSINNWGQYATVCTITTPGSFSRMGWFDDEDVTPKQLEKYMQQVSEEMEEIENAVNLGVFPNPATNKITIESDVKVNKVTIFTITGQVVGEYNTTEIDIHELASGIYFVNVATDNGTKNIKIVKE